MKRSYYIFLLLLFFGLYFNGNGQDWPNLTKYQKDNLALETSSTHNRVVFMGNSITESWSHFSPSFFGDNNYINRGISGQTTPQMLVRFRADVVDLKPAIVVILAGTNDIAGNTGPSTIKMISDNIKSMAEIARANGIKVIITSTLPAKDYPWKPGVAPAEKIITLNKQLKAFAKARNFHYVDYFSAMVDNEKGLPKRYSEDGVHPNKEGYKVMEPLIKTAIDAILKGN